MQAAASPANMGCAISTTAAAPLAALAAETAARKQSAKMMHCSSLRAAISTEPKRALPGDNKDSVENAGRVKVVSTKFHFSNFRHRIDRCVRCRRYVLLTDVSEVDLACSFLAQIDGIVTFRNSRLLRAYRCSYVPVVRSKLLLPSHCATCSRYSCNCCTARSI